MKNAIVYLLNAADKDMLNFRMSIELLRNNYLYERPCDVICFHEKNFPAMEIQYLKEVFEINFIFKEISFNTPEYPPEISAAIPEYFPHPLFPGARGFPMGYRHMCRFFAGELFKLKALREYDYVWRLDTDSFILSPINFNVFERMERTKAVYGYINIQHDHPAMVENLWETAEAYLTRLNKASIFNEEVKEQHLRRVFYTNFEVFNVSWFRAPAYQDFYNYLDETGGIYKHRWGDHAIRYIALMSLCDKSELLFFDDIMYQHGEVYHNNEITDTF